MSRFKFAAIAASLVAIATTSAPAGGGDVRMGIDVLAPPVDGGSFWDGERMQRARERLKDILPGRRF